MKNALGTKLYYSISEVADLTDLQPYTLRAWEKEFPCLRPKRARGKNRAYRERDIGVILLIKRLLYQERYTSQGVKQRLRNEPELLREAAADVANLLVEAQPDPAAADHSSDAGPGAAGPSSSVPAEGQQTPDDPGPVPGLRETLEQVKQELRAVLREL